MEKVRTRSLSFPCLVPLWDGMINGKYFRLCNLDWGIPDKKEMERYRKRTQAKMERNAAASATGPPVEEPPTVTQQEWCELEPEWESLIQGSFYLVSPNYKANIQRNVDKAQDIWNYESGLDTMCREITYEPAVSHTYVAFRLLADCLVTPEWALWVLTQKEQRRISTLAEPDRWNHFKDMPGMTRRLFASVLLSRFWLHSTGSYWVDRHADIPRVIEHAEFFTTNKTPLYSKSPEEAEARLQKAKDLQASVRRKTEWIQNQHEWNGDCNEATKPT